MYLAKFDSRERLLKTIYAILRNELIDNPAIRLYDDTKQRALHPDYPFIPVDILRNSKSVTDFIAKYEKYSDRCTGFRAFVSLDMDDELEMVFEYICSIGSDNKVIAFTTIQKVETETEFYWEEETSFDIPLFVIKAINDNKGEIGKISSEDVAFC